MSLTALKMFRTDPSLEHNVTQMMCDLKITWKTVHAPLKLKTRDD